MGSLWYVSFGCGGRNGRTVAQQRLGLITCKFCFAREGLLVSTKLPCKSAGSAVASMRRGDAWEFCKPGPRLSMQPTSALERRSSNRPSPSLCHRCLFDASGGAGPKIAGPCSFVDERLFPRRLVCVEGGQELHHCSKNISPSLFQECTPESISVQAVHRT